MDQIINVDSSTTLPIGPPVTSPPAKWPEPITMNGQFVRLEPVNPKLHADDLWECTGGLENAALWHYMAEGPFADRHSFDEAITRWATATDPACFAIVDQKSNLAVGRTAYLNIRPEHAVVEVGHLLFSSRLQRTPAATEALYLMAKHAFDNMGYRRYEWKCNALNAKSRQAAERTGFVFEGIFRQHMIVKGHSRDSAWFSILDTEWPTVRSAFEAWLSPENFDPSGMQRYSLGHLFAAKL